MALVSMGIAAAGFFSKQVTDSFVMMRDQISQLEQSVSAQTATLNDLVHRQSDTSAVISKIADQQRLDELKAASDEAVLGAFMNSDGFNRHPGGSK